MVGEVYAIICEKRAADVEMVVGCVGSWSVFEVNCGGVETDRVL